jgi:hypothetical protein
MQQKEFVTNILIYFKSNKQSKQRVMAGTMRCLSCSTKSDVFTAEGGLLLTIERRVLSTSLRPGFGRSPAEYCAKVKCFRSQVLHQDVSTVNLLF